MSQALKTILIADDEASVTSVLQRVVTRLGYEVAGIAKDGPEALTLVRSKKPNVALMDIHMPGMDGLEVTRLLLPLETTGVVIITADPEPAPARKAMDLGACGYILKPFDVNAIGPIMEAAWHRFLTMKDMREESRTLVEALETRKLMERAKGVLMKQRGMQEAIAHRSLQQMSQDHGISLKEACRIVIEGSREGPPLKNRAVFVRQVAAEVQRHRLTDSPKS